MHALSTGTGYKLRAGAALMPSAPQTDGLWLMDMISGKTKLLVSLESLLPQDATGLNNTTLTDPCFTWLSKPQVALLILSADDFCLCSMLMFSAYIFSLMHCPVAVIISCLRFPLTKYP